jgi:uncharacterized protein YeeX (DUF496 family)
MFRSRKKLIKDIQELEKKIRESESKTLDIRVQYILMRAERNRLKEEISEENRKRRDQA